ncbi:MAG: glycosyltransferase family 2 protein [Sporolactobacillus sp.]
MDVSIIVPTFNEQENVSVITERIYQLMKSQPFSYEILFVDDSTDKTPVYLQALAHRYSFVHFTHRTDQTGLATAVVTGIHQSQGRILIIMDADLQHPPEMIPQMITKIEEGYQMVIPSRFVEGGSDGGLSPYRKFVSWSARMIARFALRRIRPITDPTSGFFAVRREVIAGERFAPIGWKIMLELIIRSQIKEIAEIAYHFQPRSAGQSKMRLKEQLNYMGHLLRLVLISEEDRRFFLFCLVGLSGVIVNLAAYWFFLKLHLTVSTAFIGSSAISILTNYLLNNWLTWRMGRAAWISRLIKYCIVSVVGVLISDTLVFGLDRILHTAPMLSGIVGIVATMIWNFVLHDRWTFASASRHKGRQEELVIKHVEK